MSPATRGSVLVVTAALLWAGIGLLAQPLLDRGIDPATIAFWRAAVGGAVFAAQATVTRSWPTSGRRAQHGAGLGAGGVDLPSGRGSGGLVPPTVPGVEVGGVDPPSGRGSGGSVPPARSPLPTLAAFGVFGVGVFYLALPAAIDTGGVSLAWLLLYTAPAWVAVGAPVLLGEAVDRRTAGLVALTVVGVVLVALGGGEGVVVTPTSVAWGLLAGVSYASWYFVTQRAGTGPVATGAVALPVGALVLAPFASWPGGDAVTLALLVALGVVSTWAPALAYYAGIRELPAARASVLATVEPVAAMAFAWAVFGERLGILAVVGAVVVLSAALAAALRGR